MIETGEILQTMAMIQEQNFDIRTITLGINLLDCSHPSPEACAQRVYDKICRVAKDLVRTGEAIERELGIPIVNKRISVTPIALVASACETEDFVPFAKAMDSAAKTCGVDFIGGFSALVQKGMASGDRRLIAAIPQALAETELQTLFRPVFVNRSFACMYGKGPIRAAFNVQHDMRVARMKWGDEATVIKIDVRKFFYSIDRSVLKQIIAKRFKKLKKKYTEKYEDFLRFYRLLCKVIDSSPEGERGIPLGNVSSQDFANIYLNELDQFCIRFLGATLYTRYMDDVVVIAPNKEIAREWLAKIKVFLQERLHLETNQKTKIFYVRQGVNAYGFKIKATHLLLRTESKRKEKRRIKAMIKKLKEGKITKKEIVQAVNSWLGFARWACAYNLAKKIFAPYRFIKTEGELPYGAISRNRQARRVLQQRLRSGTSYKAVA